LQGPARDVAPSSERSSVETASTTNSPGEIASGFASGTDVVTLGPGG